MWCRSHTNLSAKRFFLKWFKIFKLNSSSVQLVCVSYELPAFSKDYLFVMTAVENGSSSLSSLYLLYSVVHAGLL